MLIEYVETISDALYALKKKKYDFILLDYFLDKSGYGYELLETVYNTYSKKTNEYKYGPHGQLYFMFISAYSSAVYERLLAEGFNRSEDCWFIAVGACPTNTPKLFSYNLLQLMDKQLKDSGILKLTAVGIYNIVNKIYNADEEEVRRAANDNYQEILNMYFLYKKMLKDINVPTTDVLDSTGSVLITDFIIKNVNMGGLLEHLIQLVHLTALGTTRQWPEMWEEYIYFKAQFNHTLFKKEFKDLSKEKKIALFGDEKITAEQSFSELCHNIEAYILTLKLL